MIEIPELAEAHYRLTKQLRKEPNFRGIKETLGMLDEQWWQDVQEFFGHEYDCHYGHGGLPQNPGHCNCWLIRLGEAK